MALVFNLNYSAARLAVVWFGFCLDRTNLLNNPSVSAMLDVTSLYLAC